MIASDAVAELQGLYGPFSFPEKLLQKIWLRSEYDRSRLVTTSGERVTVFFPGKWNLLGGPDFKGARLRFGDGRLVTGDVELHLRANDWAAHAHAEDRAYAGVVLHVVLFPPPRGHVTRAGDGHEIPVVALLPLLFHDLEEYATEDAVESLTNGATARLLEQLSPLSTEELTALIERHSRERWNQKVHFARLRVQRLGWAEACHHAALEILGYRFNRAPMLRIAGAHPRSEWLKPAWTAETLFEEERAAWSLQGVRPANHPRRRLAQYGAWMAARRSWPEELLKVAADFPLPALRETTSEVRRRGRLVALRRRLGDDLCAGAIGGTRLNNLVCDGFLPLLAAHTEADFAGLWHHWFCGDLPQGSNTVLRQLGVCGGPGRPSSHGVAQGLLGWRIAREQTEAASPGRGA